jgi:preprotein translocase subunit YajC
MLASISRGDKVVTAGGLFGTVRDILDDSLMLEVAEGVKIRVMKGSVSHKRTLDETGRPKKNGKDSGKEKGKEALPEAEKAPLPVESLPEEPTDSTGTEQK